ncbi:MAG: NAD-dependent epimerase/dehydratase family protein [Pseudomonadota bacterium]
MYTQFVWVLNAITVLLFVVSGFYAKSGAYYTRMKAVLVVQTLTAAYAVTGVAAYLMRGFDLAPVSFSILLLAWAMSVMLFLTSRLWSASWRYLMRREATSSDRDRKKKILVIGGAGYIGSALLPKLLAQGHEVRVLDLCLYGTEPIKDVIGNPNLEIMRADFRQVDVVVQAMADVDTVYHLGGLVGDPACAWNEDLTIDINLAATRLVAQIAKGNGIRRFIFASTCSVYGASEQMLDEQSELNPLSLYAKSKVASEKVLHELADETFAPIVVRFATIFGLSGRTRFDLVVNLLTAKAKLDGEITIFGGDQWRPFLHVDDAGAALLRMKDIPLGRAVEIFNVGSSKENYTINQVGDLIKLQVPEAEIVKSGSDGDNRNYRVDFSKIKMMLGFETQWTVEGGINQVIAAIDAGLITDYKHPKYSNLAYLSETKGNQLARPDGTWAHQVIRTMDGETFDTIAAE